MQHEDSLDSSKKNIYNEEEMYHDTDSENTRRNKKIKRKLARQQYRMEHADPSQVMQSEELNKNPFNVLFGKENNVISSPSAESI